MEKYLISLLEQNNRVIVPDLGAFILRQNEPKNLVFNDLLAFDDGMLTDKLMLEEKILKAEAQSRIKQYVEKARRILETGEVYPIEEMGFLRMDSSSRIEFLDKDEGSSDESKSAGSETVDKTSKDAPEDETEPESDSQDTETEKDPDQSDYEAEYMKLMSSGKKTRKKKPMVEVSEPEAMIEAEAVAETEPEQEPETVAEPKKESKTKPKADSKPKTSKQKADTKKKAGKTQSLESEDVDKGVGFILADGDSEVEVDATIYETPLQADNEEPRFLIDEDSEESEKESNEDPFKLAIADEQSEPESEDASETGAEQSPEPEPELESEPEQKEEPEPAIDPESHEKEKAVTATSAVEQARAAEEARAIAEERAAMLAARNKQEEEKPVSAYHKTEYKKKKSWPWILGLAAFIIVILAIGWFMFPDKVDSILNLGVTDVTLESQAGEQEAVTQNQETAIPDQDVTEREGQTTAESATAPDPKSEDASTPKSTSTGSPTTTSSTSKSTAATSPQPSGKQYYIVAGSFENQANAVNFVNALRAKGFDASIIGKRNNLHTVCFSSHSNKQSAEEELERIRNNNDRQAWLLYY